MNGEGRAQSLRVVRVGCLEGQERKGELNLPKVCVGDVWESGCWRLSSWATKRCATRLWWWLSSQRGDYMTIVGVVF